MIRARFKANGDDCRPAKWPPPGPYWCTGVAVDQNFEISFSIVVGYFDSEDQVREFWPEASEIDVQPVDGIFFTDRFRRPAWWPEEGL